MTLKSLLSIIYTTERIRLSEKSGHLLGYFYKNYIPDELMDKKVVNIQPSLDSDIYSELDFEVNFNLSIIIEG